MTLHSTDPQQRTPTRTGERAVMALGMVVWAGSLLSLLLVASSLVHADDFLTSWGTVSLTLSPAGIPLDRAFKPLFWRV